MAVFAGIPFGSPAVLSRPAEVAGPALCLVSAEGVDDAHVPPPEEEGGEEVGDGGELPPFLKVVDEPTRACGAP